MEKVLITGICGFIGHHVAEHILINTDWNIIGIDRLSYAANGFDRLRDAIGYPHPRVTLFSTDFTQPFSCGLIKEMGEVDYILHMGAETHVDNSIKNPSDFVFANVVGTMRVLDYARCLRNLKKFVYFSTDEVFGPAPEGTFYKEWDRYNSTNPYSATKAGGEELSLSYSNTYKIPLAIVHCMNAFGERQHPEKFIPLIINKVLKGQKVKIHSDPTRTKAGSRFYIHCRNIASAVLFVLNNSVNREKYNISGEQEVDNLYMAQFISKTLGKPLNYEMVDFHSERPGHDLRYALDGSKLHSMGWHLPKNFEESLTKTIRWYIDNPKWLEW
jgi:dTDP-glucose 4,6-dehydratase